MRRFPLLVLLVAFATWSCDPAKPAGVEPQWKAGVFEPYFFLVMADTQFGFFENNRGFAKETVRFERAISHANRLRPRFVIVCGDMTNATADRRQIAEFKRIAQQLDSDIPMYLAPGNHDVTLQPSSQVLAMYRRNFGHDWYSFRVQDAQFVVVNSSLIHNPIAGPVDAEAQWAWFQKTIQHGSELGLRQFVFLHHPFFVRRFHEPISIDNLPKERRRRYWPIFKKNRVRAVFAGHLHKNFIRSHEGVQMIITGAVGRSLGRLGSGFRIVRVYRDRIEHEFFELEKVPKQVVL